MENILKYQECEGKLIEIEMKLKKSDERKRLVKTKIFLDEVEVSILKLEKRAGELVGSYHGCQKRIDDILAELKEYRMIELDESTEDEINYMKKKTLQLKDSLRGLEKDGETISNEIQKLFVDFDNFREKVMKARKQYAILKKEFDIKKAGLKPELEELKGKMKEIEPTVDPERFSMYKKAREERIFPVFVTMTNEEFCSGCRMEISSLERGKLSIQNFIKCEHCGKWIYKI